MRDDRHRPPAGSNIVMRSDSSSSRSRTPHTLPLLQTLAQRSEAESKGGVVDPTPFSFCLSPGGRSGACAAVPRLMRSARALADGARRGGPSPAGAGEARACCKNVIEIIVKNNLSVVRRSPAPYPFVALPALHSRVWSNGTLIVWLSMRLFSLSSSGKTDGGARWAHVSDAPMIIRSHTGSGIHR